MAKCIHDHITLSHTWKSLHGAGALTGQQTARRGEHPKPWRGRLLRLRYQQSMNCKRLWENWHVPNWKAADKRASGEETAVLTHGVVSWHPLSNDPKAEDTLHLVVFVDVDETRSCKVVRADR